jgi:hypothetical protein
VRFLVLNYNLQLTLTSVISKVSGEDANKANVVHSTNTVNNSQNTVRGDAACPIYKALQAQAYKLRDLAFTARLVSGKANAVARRLAAEFEAV